MTLLCLLVAGQRGQTIWALNLNNITWGGDRVTCRIGEVLKTTSNKRHQDDLVFDVFPHSKALCVVHYLKEYVKRTENLRGGRQGCLLVLGLLTKAFLGILWLDGQKMDCQNVEWT